MTSLKQRVAACIVRGPVTLSSGKTSNVYVDKWKLLCDHWLLAWVAAEMDRHMIPGDIERVAGPEVGGAILASQMDRHWLLVRRESKGYGTRNRIEGTYKPNQRVCLIEDILTTGETALSAALALREAGLVVDTCIAIVDRQQGATELLAAHGVKVRALFSLADLLEASGAEPAGER